MREETIPSLRKLVNVKVLLKSPSDNFKFQVTMSKWRKLVNVVLNVKVLLKSPSDKLAKQNLTLSVPEKKGKLHYLLVIEYWIEN